MTKIDYDKIADGVLRQITITIDTKKVHTALFGWFGWRLVVGMLFFKIAAATLGVNLEVGKTDADA